MDKHKELLVRDIMNSDVEVLPMNATVQQAANEMREKEIGSLIIVDPNDSEKPIGIITERDMNNRVVAENKIPNKVLCKEVMSSPVASISPMVKLINAMHQMATQHIKRLIVIEQHKMVGIISQSDILQIAPYLIEVLQDMANIVKESYQTEFTAGYCQLCENWSDILVEVDGLYICPDCKEKQPSLEPSEY
ncbi:MAG: CBS domain-containing protein [Promethearchaeota archaeon]|nr:MAG: CBS domain-containing protein [Candidatus Lokiarchaeota archaeon]